MPEPSVEYMEAELRVLNLESAIKQGRLDIAREMKKIKALETDIQRNEVKLVDLRKQMELLGGNQ